MRGYFGDALQPIFGRAAAVITGAACQDEHRIDAFEHRFGAGTIHAIKQIGHDGLHTFERVANRAGLLKNLFLHVVAVGAQLGRAAVRQHGFDRALGRSHGFVGFVHQPVFAQLHINHVAFVQVDDLVGNACQGHRVRGQKVLLAVQADTQNQR